MTANAMSHNTNSHLSSKSFAEDWLNFLNVLNKQSVLDNNSPNLQDYIIDSFDPKTIIAILLSDNKAYFAQKEILFIGLTAWVACPNRLSIVREAMVLAGATELSRLEKAYKAKLPQDPLLTDVASKLIGPGIDFYRDFYYPMGGLEAIIRCRSPSLMRRTLTKTSEDIGYMAEFMSIAHQHKLFVKKGKYFREASVESCCIALSAILSHRHKHTDNIDDQTFLRPINPKNCLRKVNVFRTAATLIYAARSIAIGDKTLLDHIKAGTVHHKMHFGYFDEWIRKSVYAAEHIIAPMFTRETITEQVKFLPAISYAIIQDPSFDEYEQLIIDNAFATREWRVSNPDKVIKNLPEMK